MVNKTKTVKESKLLDNKNQLVYYVYQVYVDGVLKYIGKGKYNRIDHCTSGKSSCPELNRDFFKNKEIKAIKVEDGLTNEEAESIEMDLILENINNGIYNRQVTPDLTSKPNISLMKDVKIVASDMDEKVVKQFCKVSPNVTKSDFMNARTSLAICGLSFYLAQVGNSSPFIVIDKTEVSSYDIHRLVALLKEDDQGGGDYIGHRG